MTLEFRAMQATDADLRAFADCFESNGTPRRIDALRWQYCDNPAGDTLVDLALANGRVGAIYAVQPAQIRLKGAPVLGAQSVDTLVDAQFRGRGLFTRMADSVYERARQRGGALVYGFPNQSSAPGFFNKLGWRSLDPVPFLVRPLRTSFIASKLPLGTWLRHLPDVRLPVGSPRLRTGEELREIAELGPEIDELWERFSANIGVAVQRTSEYFRWRLNKPGERYRSLGVFESGNLISFCAYTTVDKHGGRIGYVLELLHGLDRRDAGTAVLRGALERMAADRADAVLAWSFGHSPNANAYRQAGYVPLPERLRPIELHVGVRPLDDSLAGVLSERQNWYISYCDSDTV